MKVCVSELAEPAIHADFVASQIGRLIADQEQRDPGHFVAVLPERIMVIALLI
jgi:hypothetical protein